jgi:hypothetical protein
MLRFTRSTPTIALAALLVTSPLGCNEGDGDADPSVEDEDKPNLDAGTRRPASSGGGASGDRTGAGGNSGTGDDMGSPADAGGQEGTSGRGGEGGRSAEELAEDLFASGTFAAMHEGQIRKDCAETLRCFAQMGKTVLDDPLPACLNDRAAILNSNGDQQERFLRAVQVCNALVVCEYFECMTAEFDGFGLTHRAEVTHDCQAAIDCAKEKGTFSGAESTALEDCIAARSGALDALPISDRPRYEAQFESCKDLTSCAFTECFTN